MAEFLKTCRICGKDYYAKAANGFLCSGKCKAIWRSKKWNNDFFDEDAEIKKDMDLYNDLNAKADLKFYEDLEKKRNHNKKHRCMFCPFKKSGRCKGGVMKFEQTSSSGGIYVEVSGKDCIR